MDKRLFSDIFRPVTPETLIGSTQKKCANQFIKAIKAKKPVKKLLFIGKSGTGKTTLMEMYVRYLLDLPKDADVRSHVTYMNCTAEGSINDVKPKIVNTMLYRPLGEKYRIYFLDELHGLSKAAQGTLLTPIENLPSHCVVLAGTTEKHKILDTLKSRFGLKELKQPTKQDYLKMAGWMSAKYNAEFPEDTIMEIIAQSGSNIRVYINLLQDLIEGVYSGFTEESVSPLIKTLLFSNEKNMSTIFKMARAESGDYGGVCIMTCMSAITAIINNRVRGNTHSNCQMALDIFGEGLSSQTDAETAYFRLLLNFVMNKKG